MILSRHAIGPDAASLLSILPSTANQPPAPRLRPGQRGVKATPVRGVGCSLLTELPTDFYQRPLLDFAEVSPEYFSHYDLLSGDTMPVGPLPLTRLRQLANAMPLVLHTRQLSLGSLFGCNPAGIGMLDDILPHLNVAWHSHPLSYSLVPDSSGAMMDIGTPLPVVPDDATALYLTAQCQGLIKRYGHDLLIENPLHDMGNLPADDRLGDECSLMNQICAEAHADILLNLHHLNVSARRHQREALELVQLLDLARVRAIHVTGSNFDEGFWTDTFEGQVSEGVWRLLEQTLPLCPNVEAVVYQLQPEHVGELGQDRVYETLTTLRAIWDCYGPKLAPQKQPWQQ